MPIDPDRHFPGGTLKSAAKLILLEWYLEQYVAIMEKNWDEFYYIDTHAGTGLTRCTNGTMIPGSAVRVLDEYADNFDRFYFYEIDPNHFETLCDTLSDRFGYDFDISPVESDEEDFHVARSENPRIRIMNTDSNPGVQFLANKSNPNPHWFTLLDPKGLTVRRRTLDTLMARENIDLLLTYQTSGIMRNSAEGAIQSHDVVTQTLGDDDWQPGASEDEVVDLIVERLCQRDGLDIQSKDMRDPRDPKYRFDLIFASSSEIAHRIMRHIMNERDNDLWEQASKEIGDASLGDFL